MSRLVRLFVPPHVEAGVASGKVRQKTTTIPDRPLMAGTRIKVFRALEIYVPVTQEEKVQAVNFVVLAILRETHKAPRSYMIELEGVRLTKDKSLAFAQAEGYETVAEYFSYIQARHKLPFAGLVINW